MSRAARRFSRGRACSAASPQALAGRRLALSRVHPPPGDGSAPHARLSRLPGTQYTLAALRCSITQAWRAAVAGELRRCAASVATSLPTANSLGITQESSRSHRRGRAVHFCGGCVVAAFHRWLQCHRSAGTLRARAVAEAGRGHRMTSWSWLVSLAPRGGAQEDRQGREVARNIWWGRMALYYEARKSRTLRARCARSVLDSD